MASISTQLNIVDRMSGPMYNIIGAVNSVIGSLNDVDGAINRGFDTAPITQVESELTQVSQQVNQVEDNLNEVEQQQNQVNNSFNQGSSAIDGLVGGVVSMVAAYASWQGVQKMVALSDTMTQTTARLNMMNDELSVTQDQIFAVAQSSRAGFVETGNSVAKLGLLAGKAFNSGDEILGFVDSMNKAFVVGGSSIQEQTSAMYQLTQAMAAGKLQGDEYRSIIENAPMLATAIEQYMTNAGVSGTMKEWASQGLLTADVIKNALFSVSDDINAQFESMPMTWGQVWTGICNQLIIVMQPLLEFISFLAQNWAILEPIVIGAALALGLYTTALLVHKGIAVASAIATAWQTRTTIAQSLANMKAATTQAAFNAALFSCPITWIVTITLALVAAIIALCSWIAKSTGVAGSFFGVITGGINVALQAIKNTGMVVANIAIGIWSALGACCTNIWTAFHNVIANVQGWFFGLLSTALTVVEGICKALNKLPFVEFDYSGITAKADEYAAKSAESYGSVEDYTSVVDAFSEGASTFDAFADGWVSDAFEAGAAWGDGLGGGGGDGADIGGYGTGDVPVGGDALDTIAGNTGSGVSISEENMKYLRDLAEQETVNRFTTAEIKVDMTNNNNISKDTDLDGMIDYLVVGLEDAMARSAEGVHS